MYLHKGKGVFVLAAVVVLLLAVATPSFAQVAFSTFSLPRQVRGEGRTETMGDVTIQTIPGGTIPGGSSITIVYSGTITNTPTFQNVFIGATQCTGAGAPDAACPSAVNFTAGTNSLTLSWSANTALAANTAITISGVRVDVANLGTGTTSVTATLSGTSSVPGAITFSNPTLPVATVVAKSLTVDFTGAPESLLTCKVNAAGAANLVTLDITENFPAALTTLAQEASLSSTPPPSQGSLVEVTLSGIPAGFSITNIAAVGSGVLAGTLSDTSFAGSAIKNGSVTFTFEPTATDTSAIETLSITFNVENPKIVASGAPGNITATVALAPMTDVAAKDLTLPDDIVSFKTNTQGSDTVATISDCVTQLLFPWIINVGGFNTGVAIANTTNDAAAFGSGSATPQSGSCALTAMPADGVSAPITGTVGPIPAGGTGTFLASDKFPGFAGHVFAVCQFLNAHAFAFISDSVGRPNPNVAEGYLGLVVPTGSRVIPGGEGLVH